MTTLCTGNDKACCFFQYVPTAIPDYNMSKHLVLPLHCLHILEGILVVLVPYLLHLLLSVFVFVISDFFPYIRAVIYHNRISATHTAHQSRSIYYFSGIKSDFLFLLNLDHISNCRDTSNRYSNHDYSVIFYGKYDKQNPLKRFYLCP